MDQLTEIVVVGAGVIGASSAAHLARAGHRVTVVEARSGSADGSTGRSFGAVRAQWADAMNVALSWESIQRLRAFPEEHGVDVGFQPLGYLMLVPEASWEAQLAAVELQRSYGVPVEVLDVERSRAVVPHAPEGVAGATWCGTDGVVDPRLLTDAYLDQARAAGADVWFDHPVTEVNAGADGQWRVRAGDKTITAQWVVNAAGGWAGELGNLAGMSIPVEHSRRSMYAASATTFDRYVPMTIDLSTGIFVRTRGDHVVFSLAPPNPDPGYFDTPDWDWFEVVQPRAYERFPWLADLPLDRSASWGGTYEVTPDLQGILGPDPSAPTWVNACGFSGHGLMQAPVIGQLVAEQLGQGRMTSFDVDGLRPERFVQGVGLHRAGLVV